MELRHQVCSLDLSKRLKELGVQQKSLFYWHCSQSIGIGMMAFSIMYGEIPNPNCQDTSGMYSAFTVAELGEMIGWEKLFIYGIPEDLLSHIDGKNTESDARAKMLIYMIENNLISSWSINQNKAEEMFKKMGGEQVTTEELNFYEQFEKNKESFKKEENYQKLLELVKQIHNKNPESYDEKSFAWICVKTVAENLLKEIGE